MNDTSYRLGKLQAGVELLLQQVEKINPCHNSSDGKFCSTGGGSRKRGGRLSSLGSAFGPPTEETPKEDRRAMVANLRSKLGGTIVAEFQARSDPDLARILSKGKQMSTKGATADLGPDGKCHWNTSKLYSAGKIDKIAIGYAKDPIAGKWHQHTWGIKSGKIVETTSSNVGNKAYYGIQLSKKESTAFAKWTGKNPPGAGKVRTLSQGKIEFLKRSANTVTLALLRLGVSYN